MAPMNDSARRRWLLSMIAGGAMSSLAPRILAARDRPTGRSIHELRGRVQVNGALADLETPIIPGDVVETGRSGYISFAVNQDAFLLRENGKLELGGRSRVLDWLRVVSGGLLSVFGSGRKELRTSAATIGIRGTGLYLEAAAERDYFCLCYGEADLSSNANPDIRERVVSHGHESPRFIGADDGSVSVAPVFNHTVMELAMLESLVGRPPVLTEEYKDESLDDRG